jgi:hypothetical protein
MAQMDASPMTSLTAGTLISGAGQRRAKRIDVAPRDTADFGKTREVIGYAGLNARAFDGRLRNRFSVL